MDPYLPMNREDRELAVGARVEVFWSTCGYPFAARGKIVRLDRLSIDIELSNPIPASRDHPKIRQVTVARIADSVQWSPGRCVRLERPW